ncbi:MAG: DUF2782 domain-containing protein [Pseudomonadota bacterium]
MSKQLALSAALLLSLAPPAFAQEDVPPPPPAATTPGDSVPEPEVTIRQTGEQNVEEYRIKGRLYMVKITPKDAPPYYLIDNDGDGELETRHFGPLDSPAIPHWILLRW